jgi:hypothetical protein
MFASYFHLTVIHKINEVSYIQYGLRSYFWAELQKSYNFHILRRFRADLFSRRMLCFTSRDVTWQLGPIHTFTTVHVDRDGTV